MPESGCIIIDTNFLSGKSFNAKKLSSLSERLAKRGHVTAVSQVVIWEWASHAHDSLEELAARHAEAKRAISPDLGFDLPTPPSPGVEELIGRIEAVIESMADVLVLPIDDDDGVDALRQQVAQVGMGSRLKGVKTGAADGAIVHAVRRASDSYDQVVLASADKGLRRQTEELGSDVVVTPDERALWRWHGATEPPSEELAAEITAFIHELMAEALAEGGVGPVFDEGYQVDRGVYRAAGFSTEDSRQIDVVIESMDGLELSQLEVVVGDEVPRLVVADLRVEALLGLTNWFIGGFDAELLSEYATEDCILTVPVTVELDENWSPTEFEVNESVDVEARVE